MAKKKVVIFLVEGFSEINALGSPFESIFKVQKYHGKECIVRFGRMKNSRYYRDPGGDITGEKDVNVHNIKKRIVDWMIKPILIDFYAEDIEEVIHIVDMDGAYIPLENIVPQIKKGEKRVTYEDGKIFACFPEDVKERNDRKSKNLNFLQTVTTIEIKHTIHSYRPKGKGERHSTVVPYSVYYFSSNLDHYIHHDANMMNCDKVRQAGKFGNKCSKNMDFFYKTFIQDPDSVCDGTYKDSWEFIKTSINSVERHTNIGIFINTLKQ